MSVIDLYCGCGGLSLGFREEGFDVSLGLDSWQVAVDTYTANAIARGVVQDLSDVDDSIMLIDSAVEQVSGIIGGPPCQDFSSAGQRLERTNADQTVNFARFVEQFSPDFFVMENVPLSAKSRAFSRAMEVFVRSNYEVHSEVFDAAFFSVPQNRRRLFTVGAKQVGFAQGFARAMEVEKSDQRLTIAEGFPYKPDFEFYYRHPRSYARRGVFGIDEPSPTIRGVNRPRPASRVWHKNDRSNDESIRSLTAGERALIQTFPQDFVFCGSRSVQEQQIGNAVPVNLARAIARSVKSVLSS